MASLVLPAVVAEQAKTGVVRRHTVAVVMVALMARAAVVWYALRHFPGGWFYTRGVEMGLLAASLVRGTGLSSPFGGDTGPTAMIAPGYPVLVAGVFRVSGVLTPGAAVAMMALQAAVGGVTVWLILRVARRVACERVAVWVSLLWACSPVTVWMPTIFWETNFSAALLLGFVLLTMDLETRGGWRWWLHGGYAGVAGLMNPALLPALFGMTGWACWRGRPRWGIVAAGIAFVVVFASWPVRNARVFGAFVPTRTTVGFELWMGNRVGATGFLDESLFPMFNRGELADYRARGELGYMAHKTELAKAYVRTHPAATARLTMVRAARFWMGLGNSKGSILFVLYALLTSALGGVGLLGFWRSGDRRLVILFAVPLILFPLPYYVTHAEFRYRLVLDPVLCVLAAKGLDGGWCGEATEEEEEVEMGQESGDGVWESIPQGLKPDSVFAPECLG